MCVGDAVRGVSMAGSSAGTPARKLAPREGNNVNSNWSAQDFHIFDHAIDDGNELDAMVEEDARRACAERPNARSVRRENRA
jgi:hypothetical protein